MQAYFKIITMDSTKTQMASLNAIRDWTQEDVKVFLVNNSLEEYLSFADNKSLDGHKLLTLSEGFIAMWRPKISPKKLMTIIDDLKQNPEKYLHINNTQLDDRLGVTCNVSDKTCNPRILPKKPKPKVPIRKESLKKIDKSEEVSVNHQDSITRSKRKKSVDETESTDVDVKEEIKSASDIDLGSITPPKSFLYSSKLRLAMTRISPYAQMENSIFDKIRSQDDVIFRKSKYFNRTEDPAFDLENKTYQTSITQDRGYYEMSARKSGAKFRRFSDGDIKDENLYEELLFENPTSDQNGEKKKIGILKRVLRKPTAKKIKNCTKELSHKQNEEKNNTNTTVNSCTQRTCKINEKVVKKLSPLLSNNYKLSNPANVIDENNPVQSVKYKKYSEQHEESGEIEQTKNKNQTIDDTSCDNRLGDTHNEYIGNPKEDIAKQDYSSKNAKAVSKTVFFNNRLYEVTESGFREVNCLSDNSTREIKADSNVEGMKDNVCEQIKNLIHTTKSYNFETQKQSELFEEICSEHIKSKYAETKHKIDDGSCSPSVKEKYSIREGNCVKSEEEDAFYEDPDVLSRIETNEHLYEVAEQFTNYFNAEEPTSDMTCVVEEYLEPRQIYPGNSGSLSENVNNSAKILSVETFETIDANTGDKLADTKCPQMAKDNVMIKTKDTVAISGKTIDQTDVLYAEPNVVLKNVFKNHIFRELVEPYVDCSGEEEHFYEIAEPLTNRFGEGDSRFDTTGEKDHLEPRQCFTPPGAVMDSLAEEMMRLFDANMQTKDLLKDLQDTPHPPVPCSTPQEDVSKDKNDNENRAAMSAPKPPISKKPQIRPVSRQPRPAPRLPVVSGQETSANLEDDEMDDVGTANSDRPFETLQRWNQSLRNSAKRKKEAVRMSMAERPLPVPVENEFYYMEVGRAEAEALLEGHADGTFILRPSSQKSHAYTVTLTYMGRIYNIGCRRREDGRLALGFSKTNEQNFLTINQLIEHYYTEKLVLLVEGKTVGSTTLRKLNG